MRLGAGRKRKTAAETSASVRVAVTPRTGYADLERGGQPLGTVARVAILRFLAPRRRR